VVDVVHSNGSFIYLQLWALGRAATNVILEEGGYDLVSASNVPLHPRGGVPRPLTKDEIAEYVKLYTDAGENAMKAGFDGVEIHAQV
jgi:NADPH2 dehydrogenase